MNIFSPNAILFIKHLKDFEIEINLTEWQTIV